MNKQKTNILIVGLLKTGSSALIDMLSEYDNVQVVPGEFDDFRAPGLVSDHLSLDKNVPLYDISQLTTFRTKLKKLYDVFPIAHWHRIDLNSIGSRFKLSILRNKQLKLLEDLNQKLLSNISIEKKIKHAKEWIEGIGKINNSKNEIVVYNNALEVANDIQIWKRVFHPFKLIIVYRNPKDQLADIIKNEYLFAPYGAPVMNFGGVTLETIYGRSREGAINFHIDAIRKRYEWVQSLREQLDSDQLLLVDFEGLVKNYEVYKTEIEEYIGIHNHRYPKHFFNPNEAKKSISLYKNFLKENEIGLLSRLEYWYEEMIEKNSKQF